MINSLQSHKFKRILLPMFLFAFTMVHAQKITDALHCLGNGQYCVYQNRADIKSLFGPTYSSPSYLQLNLSDNNIVVESSRFSGAAIWKHTLSLNGDKIAEITDFVDSELPVLVRKIVSYKKFTLNLAILNSPKIVVLDNSSEFSSQPGCALMVHKDRGLPIFGEYEHPYEQFHQILVQNAAKISKTSLTEDYNIEIGLGESEIYFIGGPFYQECYENSKNIQSLDYQKLFNRTLKSWKDFTSRRHDFNKLISDKNKNKQQILEQIDNVAVLLKTQQSSEGAVIAGDFYHLAYVRDQYGVSRGFLAMGYYEEAKKILDFYWQIWQKFGLLHNAQAIGVPGVFHIHENDEVEQTGYLIIQAFDYLNKTNDKNFIKTIFPMLEWAWNVQKKNLVKGMLPFNGDETYVAGGILPRTALNDGSSESTLLFIQSGELLLPFIEKNKLWKKANVQSDKKLVQTISGQYIENFVHGGQIIANNPLRMSIEEMPDFRHGVCAGWHGVVYTKKDKNGNYLCPKCSKEKREYPPFERKSVFIPSIALTPYYIGSKLISDQILQQNIDIIRNNYLNSGQISSRKGEKKVIGYEYGFFLYALAVLQDPIADKVFEDTMAAVDESGAWVEYYNDGKPMGCRYRPWESGINIEAIIKYALSKKQQ